MQEFDVVVVGGGLVGASFVRAISASGRSVLLIDQAPAESLYHPDLDNRGLAISYTTKKILEDLNVWSDLIEYAYPINDIHISEQGSFGFTKLSAQSVKLAALGYVISASMLGKALVTGLERLPNITIMRPTTIQKMIFDVDTNRWHLQLSSAQVTAKLVVAADGSNSSVRKWQDIPMHHVDRQETAIVTNVQIDIKKSATAYERFTKQGIIALLPFGVRTIKCVWTLDKQSALRLLNMSDQEFMHELQLNFGYRLGKFIAITPRKSFPIHTVHADQLYKNCIVFIGNAANTLHPVAAQGFNLGIRDAMCLAKSLSLEWTATTITEILQKYAQQRIYDHQTTRNFTNRLVNVFSNTSTLIKRSRGVGLVLTNLIPSLNKKIIAQGLGTWT